MVCGDRRQLDSRHSPLLLEEVLVGRATKSRGGKRLSAKVKALRGHLSKRHSLAQSGLVWSSRKPTSWWWDSVKVEMVGRGIHERSGLGFRYIWQPIIAVPKSTRNKPATEWGSRILTGHLMASQVSRGLPSAQLEQQIRPGKGRKRRLDRDAKEENCGRR